MTFAHRPPAWLAAGVPEVSRFSCMKFPAVLGSTTTQGRRWTRAHAHRHVAFRYKDDVGTLIADFRSSIPSPPVPLFTLRPPPRDDACKTRGQDGSLLLSSAALSSATSCRFIPAHPYPPPRYFQSGSTATPPPMLLHRAAPTPLTSCLSPGVHSIGIRELVALLAGPPVLPCDCASRKFR